MHTLEAVTDSDLRETVLHAIRAQPEVASADVTVEVQDGVATLTGFVHSYFAKLAAEEAAKQVAGVEGLANDIQVKLGQEASDPEIARGAVLAIREVRELRHFGVTVTVRDGLLTLEGSVENWRQKRAAEDAVMSVHGAKGVISRLVIRARA